MKVYTRDASWFDRPDTRTPKVFHASTGDELYPAAACSGAPLDETTGVEYDEIRKIRLCCRAGCTRAFVAGEEG